MAKLNRRSISRRTVEALKVEKDTVFWDRDLPGFGIRVYASGTKMYVVQSRTKGKSVRVTVGRHGVISADEARRRAARIVNRIKAGEVDPSRKSGGALHRLHCFCLEFDGACEVQRRVPTDWIIEPIDVSGYGSFSLAS